jgi:aminoacrylate hydrolase
VDGYTISQLAQDMASLLEYLDLGPTHIVGSSTGGAIAQLMALQKAAIVRSVTITSSFARIDPFMQREFHLRRKLMAEADPETVYACYALFLFSPDYANRHPEAVANWISRAAAAPLEREIALKRIDMILGHNELHRLSAIRQPSLIMCGDLDFCTPLHLSREIAQKITNAEFVVLPSGGHMIHHEQEDRYFDHVRAFLRRH